MNLLEKLGVSRAEAGRATSPTVSAPPGSLGARLRDMLAGSALWADGPRSPGAAGKVSDAKAYKLLRTGGEGRKWQGARPDQQVQQTSVEHTGVQGGGDYPGGPGKPPENAGTERSIKPASFPETVVDPDPGSSGPLPSDSGMGAFLGWAAKER